MVEVANELLRDAMNSEAIITQACTEAISNLLLQQVLYGTGVEPQMKGIAKYTGFADSGSKADVQDLYSLATAADTALRRANGTLEAMLYDVALEPRFNTRLFTGELIQPSRAFQRLYDAGRTLAHPSVAAGDLFFWQSSELYIGFVEDMTIEADWYSAFASNNTKFRVVMRGDIFANVARMVYYKGIPVEAP